MRHNVQLTLHYTQCGLTLKLAVDHHHIHPTTVEFVNQLLLDRYWCNCIYIHHSYWCSIMLAINLI